MNSIYLLDFVYYNKIENLFTNLLHSENIDFLLSYIIAIYL